MTTLPEFLATHDADCPACRHSLRGLLGDQCPECGSMLELGVFRPHAGPGWTAVLIGMSLCLGQGFIVSTYLVLVMINGGRFPISLPVTFIALTLCSGFMLAHAVRRERVWMRMPGSVRRALVGLALLSGVVLPAGLVAVAALT